MFARSRVAEGLEMGGGGWTPDDDENHRLVKSSLSVRSIIREKISTVINILLNYDDNSFLVVPAF